MLAQRDQQIEQIIKLKEALEKLNKINLTPFQDAMQQLKDNMQKIGQQVLQTWTQFWSNLVSGQASAGKKFLAGLLDIIAQQLQIMAIKQQGEAVDAFASGNFAGGAAHEAAAAALGALGGILQGFASSLSSSSASASAAVAPAGASSPTPAAPQSVSVGQTGGAQNSGQAQSTQHTVTLEIQPSQAFVVKTVKQNVQGNGTLRTLIKQNA